VAAGSPRPSPPRAAARLLGCCRSAGAPPPVPFGRFVTADFAHLPSDFLCLRSACHLGSMIGLAPEDVVACRFCLGRAPSSSLSAGLGSPPPPSWERRRPRPSACFRRPRRSWSPPPASGGIGALLFSCFDDPLAAKPTTIRAWFGPSFETLFCVLLTLVGFAYLVEELGNFLVVDVAQQEVAGH
jgi:hypothetical protein